MWKRTELVEGCRFLVLVFARSRQALMERSPPSLLPLWLRIFCRWCGRVSIPAKPACDSECTYTSLGRGIVGGYEVDVLLFLNCAQVLLPPRALAAVGGEFHGRHVDQTWRRGRRVEKAQLGMTVANASNIVERLDGRVRVAPRSSLMVVWKQSVCFVLLIYFCREFL